MAHLDDIVRAVLKSVPDKRGITQISKITAITPYQWRVEGRHFRRILSFERAWLVSDNGHGFNVEEVTDALQA